MKALLIAEKPSVMRDIQNAYRKMTHPDQIDFTCLAGHAVRLNLPKEYESRPEWAKRSFNNLPMIPKPFEYAVIGDKVTMYNDIVRKLKSGNYDYVINACDPAREGQLIFHAFFDTTGIKLPAKRIWLKDTTEPTIQKELLNLIDESDHKLTYLTQSSKLRSYFDWLVGINFSTGLSLASNSNIAVGRVMTPTLKLTVDRELEIRNFKPESFFTLQAEFSGYVGNYSPEKEAKFATRKEINNFVSSLEKKGVITNVERKTEKKKAPSLFDLQSLQAEASRIYGYSMSQTLKIAQRLYEQKKVLSYPRTDSQFLTTALTKEFANRIKPLLSIPELAPLAREVLSDSACFDRVAKDKSYVNDAKVSDHYALIPTGVVINMSELDKEERNIFELVSRKFLSIFLSPLVVEKSVIETLVNEKYRFLTNGSIVKDQGFTRAYTVKSNDTVLPNVKKGEVRDVTEYKVQAKKTKPPLRFTDGTLGVAMENAGRFSSNKDLAKILKESKGIGQPSTRGSIIDKLLKKEWLKYDKKNIIPTESGIELIQALGAHQITSVDLTAVWESRLVSVENGDLSANDFYKQMIGYVASECSKLPALKMALKSSQSHSASRKSESLGKCPSCGESFLSGQKYYLCSKYKDGCSFIFGKTYQGASISKTEAKKIIAGKHTKVLQFTFASGKAGEGTLFYDKGRNNISISFSRK